MTQPTDPSHGAPTGPAADPYAAGASITPVPLDQSSDVLSQGPSGSGGSRKGLLIGAGVLAVALVGAGGAFAASRLGGGGAQPDEVVPASAIAFVAVDLDPSAGQKLDALRFLRKFPDTKDALGASDDLRKALFEGLAKDGELKGDYATDVEPWLGQRAGVAVLPPAQDGEDPGVVAVLAVTDQAKAKAGIDKVTGGEATCEYTEDFAVCSDDAAVAKKAVADAEKKPLSENDSFTSDLDALGEQGIARGWFDLAKVAELAPQATGLTGSLGAGQDVSGRAAFAVRFDGPNLELTGAAVGTKSTGVTLTGTAPMADLPSDTVAALGLSSADDLVTGVWTNLRKSLDSAGLGEQLDAQVQQFQQQYGLSVPDDVAKAVGDHVAVLTGPAEDGQPTVAVRVGGDPATVDKIAGLVGDVSGLSLGRATAGSDSVLASSQQYADAVAKGSGLAGEKAFTDAVPDAKDASVVAFVNFAALLAQYPDQLTGDAAKNLAPLSAFGASARQDGDRAEFTLRLVTK